MKDVYYSLLRQYIADSKMSLSEIETAMRAQRFTVSKSYLSNLQNGKLEPPSPEVSYMLADITGGDPVHLVGISLMVRLGPLFASGAPDTFLPELSRFLASGASLSVSYPKEITLEERRYLNECLQMYRKLKLRPGDEKS